MVEFRAQPYFKAGAGIALWCPGGQEDNVSDDKALRISAEIFYTRQQLIDFVDDGNAYDDGYTILAGGNVYMWQAGATAIPDLPGLVPAGTCYNTHFGSSPSDANAATKLNIAIAGAVALGVELVLVAGTYTIGSVVNIISGLRLRGIGREHVTLIAASTYFGSILSAGVTYFENVSIEHMTLDGNSQRNVIGAAGHTIAGYHFDNFALRHLRIQNSLGYGIGLQGYPFASPGKQGPQEDLIIDDVEVIFCGHGKFRQSTIVGAVGSGDTSITVADISQFDASGGTMQIGSEIIRYGAPTGSVLPVVRGICGTTAAAYSDGATVYRLANGDGLDAKSGRRFWINNYTAMYCGDQGLNIRCRNATIISPKLIGNVLGMGLNAIGTASNTASTLNGALTATDATITLADASSFPTSGIGRVDAEQVTWTGKAGNQLTGVTRGTDGTVAVSHLSGVSFALDSGDDAEDSMIQVLGGIAEGNVLSGVSVASGSGSATCQVEFHGFVCDDNSSGYNLSGAGAGQTRVRIIGGITRNNTEYGVYAAYMESVHIMGLEAYDNGSDAIRIFMCPNGGSVIACDIRNNGGWGCVETGNTDRVTYAANKIYNNTTGNLRIIGLRSRCEDRWGWYGNYPGAPNPLGTGTSAQNMFAENTVLPPNSKIRFNLYISITNMSSSNGTFAFSFDQASAGVAALTNIYGKFKAKKAPGTDLTTDGTFARFSGAAGAITTAANTETDGVLEIEGTIRTAAGGLFIPQITLSQSAANASIISDAYCEWRIVSDKDATTVELFGGD